MRTLRLLPLLALLSLLFVTCKNDTTEPTTGEGAVSGLVTDALTGGVVTGATVTSQGPVASGQYVQTDAEGRFLLKFSLDSTGTMLLGITRQGYRDTTITVQVLSGTTSAVTIRLVSTLPAGPAVLNGVVKDATTGLVIAGATVKSSSPQLDPRTAVSGADGRFQMVFPVDSSFKGSTADLSLSVARAGYRDTSFAATITFGSGTPVTLRLMPRGGIASVSGTAVDATTASPLAGTSVTAQVISPVQGIAQTAVTNIIGEFNFLFAVDTVSIVRVSLTRTGYRDTAVYLKANPTAPVVAAIGMRQGIAGGGGTGLPQTIAFLDVTPPELSVYGVGGKETAILDWEVRDSLGNPVDANHAALLTFSVVNGPGGGEYLSPTSIMTTASGRASITFNAGIRSGVAQVVASTVSAGRTITSAPIRVIIDGGFPDQAHFSIATTMFNFPALGIMGLRDPISVLVGDKYSNPAVNSAVYFRSSAGVIQGTFGTAVTTKDGQGTVDLISGNPEPFGLYAAAAYGNGYHYVVARTVGQAGVTVQDSILLLWSGPAVIDSITPSSFDIQNGRSQEIAFRVADPLGHPLARGTTISVTASIPPPPVDGMIQNKVALAFGDKTNTLILPDVIRPGSGTTLFKMTLSDGSWSVVDSAGTPVTVTITVTGPNTTGAVTANISGVVH